MKVCIVTTPIRPIPTDFPPFGSMAIIQSLRKIGIDAAFYNIDYFRYPKEDVAEFFRDSGFDVIGISAVVSTAYAYTKWLTLTIKSVSPKSLVVVGGNLAAAAEILHRKSGVDFCVVGDGEIIFTNLLLALRTAGSVVDKSPFALVKGITYLDPDGSLKFTGYGERPNRDEIEDPDYKILEKDGSISHYIPRKYSRVSKAEHVISLDSQKTVTTEELQFGLNNQRKVTTATVISSKGCVARCTFCHRWEKGYRVKPEDRIIAHIKSLISDYQVDEILFGDENFGADREFTRHLVAELGKLDISWNVAGVRARTVTAADLKLWAANGCKDAIFGMESGSAKILRVMEKNATVEENTNALKWTGEAGLHTVIQLVLGMPGENDETIADTIAFLKTVGPYMIDWNKIVPSDFMSINYAQALPGTPLYQWVRENGFVGDTLDAEERYLINISDIDAYATDHFLNYTGLPMLKVLTWRTVIVSELDAHHFRLTTGTEWISLADVISHYARFMSKKLLGHKGGQLTPSLAKRTASGYFNFARGLKFGPLLLNRYTRHAFKPIVYLNCLRGRSLAHVLRLLSEFVIWYMKANSGSKIEEPSKSLRKVILLQKESNAEPDAVELRLGR